MKKYWLGIGCVALVLLGFGHAPVRKALQLDDPEISQLRLDVEAALAREVLKKPDLLQLNEARVTGSEPGDREGSVKLVYHLSFETKGSEGGQVTEEVDAYAILDPTAPGAKEWKLRESAPIAQALNFHEPLEIRGKPHENL